MKTILVTSGDVDGIGFEIASRSIAQIKIPKNFRIVLFRPKTPLKDWSTTYKRKYKTASVSSNQELNFILEDTNSPTLIEFISGDSPVDWVEATTRMCLRDSNFSLVNAPMSKSLIAESGRKDHGHTDIFKRIGQIRDVNMAFIGKYFSIILATDHISLSSVEDHLSNFDKRLGAVSMFRKIVKSNVKCAVLGLNPHASEGGIIGKFEDIFKSNKIQQIMNENNIFGPFAADSFFASDTWKEYPLIFAMYHDQGLVPFKMQHRKSASVHLTLGIPFVRTSVDHGTAKDIANKGIADFGSMLEAIKLNIKLASRGTNV